MVKKKVRSERILNAFLHVGFMLLLQRYTCLRERNKDEYL